MESKSPKERLLIVLRRGNADKVEALIKQFPDELNPDLDADSAENKIIHRAARYGHSKVVETLLKLGANPRSTNKFGMTPLHHAAVHGSSAVIKALIDGGCDVNQADNAGRLPLHWAATKGHVEGSLQLLDGGAQAAEADKEGFTPLHRCAQEEPEDAKSAPTEAGAEPTPPTEEEELARLERRQEQERNKAEIAAELIKRGADIGAEESKGKQTPLHLAAMNGLEVVGDVLLGHGADCNKINKIGQTPLIYACIEKHTSMAKLLLQYGANPSLGNPVHWDWAPLHWAALSDDQQLVQVILDGGGLNIADKSGRTPAVLAEEHHKFNVLDLLNSIPVVK